MKIKENKSTYQKYLEDKHKKFETPGELIEKVVKDATGGMIVSRKKIVEGEVNEVYDIATSGGANIIVRISRLGPNSFTTEQKVIEMVQEVGVPSPKVLLVKEIKSGTQDLTFCVEEKIEGEPLKNLLKTLDKKSLKKYLFQAGEILSKIHSIHVDVFGPMDDPLIYKSWEEYIFKIEKVKKVILKGANQAGINESIIEGAFGILKRNNSFFDVKETRLLHGDFSPKHLLVKKGRITGIIDFEDAKGGDPIKDIAWLNFYYHESFPIEWILEGYQNKEILGPNFETKMKLYRLHHGLDILDYYYREKNISGLNFAKKNLEMELKNFKNH